MFPTILKNNKILYYIVITGFTLRILFLLFGAYIYYGGNIFINHDSFSFTQSFINLYKHGSYAFDLNNPDSFMRRLPGYSFFWGIHYLLFGEKHVYLFVALTQIILDTVVILLISKLSYNIFKSKKTALITAMLYATFPFVIIWNTQSTTETIASFYTVLTFYLLSKDSSLKNIFMTCIVCTLAFFTRPYLGILVVPTLLYFFFIKKRYINSLIGGFFFLSLISIWPIRNYVNHDKIMLANIPGAGYERYTQDIVSARQWIHSWSNDPTYYLDNFSIGNFDCIPSYAFNDNEEKQMFEKIKHQINKCGSGFYYWKNNNSYPHKNNCNIEIEKCFNELVRLNISKRPLYYYTHTPLLNLKKAFFKFNKRTRQTGIKKIIFPLLFSYRSILVLLGFIGIFTKWEDKKVWPLSFFILFMYSFICFVFRQLEMRYLLQADIMLLIFSAFTIFNIYNKFNWKW